MSSKLMYLQIEQEIRRRILSGEYPQGSQLPTEKELGEEFGASRLTVSKGLSNLVQDGLISRTRGRGSFVQAQAQIQIPHEVNAAESPNAAPGIFKFISPPSSKGEDILESNQLLEGMTDAVRKFGYNVSIDFFSSIEEEQALVQEYSKPLNNGFAIWTTSDQKTKEQLKILRNARFPYIQLDHFFPDLNGNFLLTDGMVGARMLIDHLYELGHRRIAYLTVSLDRISVEERYAGTLLALGKHHLNTNDYVGIIPTAEGINLHELKEKQKSFVSRWLDSMLSMPKPPTAIFCSNDTLAITILNLLKDKGISVPRQISVAGFDNIQISSWVPVPLTTLAHDFYHMGFLAGEILMRQQDSKDCLPFQYRIDPKLIVRQSTGPAPKD